MFLEQLRPVVSLLVRLGVAKRTFLCLRVALKKNKEMSQSPAVSLRKNFTKCFVAITPWRLLPMKTWRRTRTLLLFFIVLEIILYPESFRGSAGPAELRPGRGRRLLADFLVRDGTLLGLLGRNETLRLWVESLLSPLFGSRDFDLFLSS